MKILLAIDESQFADSATQMVISQNRLKGTQVRVVHVVEPTELLSYSEMPVAYSGSIEVLRKENLQHARKMLTRVGKKLKAAGFKKVETSLQEGNIKTRLVDMATEWGAELVVMGSHGRKGLNRILLGSISEYVVRHAPCSVQIVRLAEKK